MINDDRAFQPSVISPDFRLLESICFVSLLLGKSPLNVGLLWPAKESDLTSFLRPNTEPESSFLERDQIASLPRTFSSELHGGVYSSLAEMRDKAVWVESRTEAKAGAERKMSPV